MQMAGGRPSSVVSKSRTSLVDSASGFFCLINDGVKVKMNDIIHSGFNVHSL